MSIFGQDEGIAARANVLVEADPATAPDEFSTVGCILNHTPPPMSREAQDDEPCMNFALYPDWQPTFEYEVGNLVNNAGNRYRCTVAGTSGVTGPTHSMGNQPGDGTAWWIYLSPHASGDDYLAAVPSPPPGDMENSEFVFTTVWEPGTVTTLWLEEAIRQGRTYKWEIMYSNGYVQQVNGWVRQTVPQQGNRGSGKWKTDITVVCQGDWTYRFEAQVSSTGDAEPAEPEPEPVA